LSEETLQRYYKSCHEYYSKLKEREKNFETWFSKYYKFLSVNQKKVLVLDVGCGIGQVASKLAEEGLECVGVDISPIGIRTAVRGLKKNTNAFFIVASTYSLPFKQEAFGTVGCFDLLEHLNNPEKCLDEMLRTLKQNGTIVVASPNLLCPVYVKGVKQKIQNTRKLLSKIVNSNADPVFGHLEPKLDWTGKEVGFDLDATTCTDPMTLRKLLKNKKTKLVYQSSYLGSKQSLEKLSKFPLIRSIGAGIFLVGKKK